MISLIKANDNTNETTKINLAMNSFNLSPSFSNITLLTSLNPYFEF